MTEPDPPGNDCDNSTAAMIACNGGVTEYDDMVVVVVGMVMMMMMKMEALSEVNAMGFSSAALEEQDRHLGVHEHYDKNSFFL
jgi:hypothetical protein